MAARGATGDRSGDGSGAPGAARVVTWAHLPPGGGGHTTVACALADDPDLRRHFAMEMRGTQEAAPDQAGRANLRNAWRGVRDAVSLFRQVRGVAVIGLFSPARTTTVVLRTIFLAAAARLRGARVFVWLGSGMYYQPDPDDFVAPRGMRPLYRVLGRLVDVVVVIDENALPVLGPMVRPARIEMIPSPVDDDHFVVPPREPRDPVVLLHVGRVTVEKGVPDLLAACRILEDRGVTNWELRLVGPLGRSVSSELQDIERTAAELGRVTVVGLVPDVAPQLADADVFVSASHLEGLAGSIAEACISGLPVVATRVGAVASVVEDNVNGYLVPVSDPPAFADAVQKLLDDPSLRRQMGTIGQERARARYGRRPVAARYVELIEGLIARG